MRSIAATAALALAACTPTQQPAATQQPAGNSTEPAGNAAAPAPSTTAPDNEAETNISSPPRPEMHEEQPQPATANATESDPPEI